MPKKNQSTSKYKLFVFELPEKQQTFSVKALALSEGDMYSNLQKMGLSSKCQTSVLNFSKVVQDRWIEFQT